MRRLLLALSLLAAPGFAQNAAIAPAPAALAPLQYPVPEKDQWLYGSGEGSVAALQVYSDLTRFALAARAHRPRQSVIAAAGSSPTGAAPLRFEPCGRKPLAVVLDADETLIWNAAETRWVVEHRSAHHDVAIWDQWEKTGASATRPVPGAAPALAAMRRAGITPIVISNHLAVNADGTAAALAAAGLGSFVHGKTLFLKGDDELGSNKDGRRALVAKNYCVVAIAGDQLGDFSEAFNVKGVPVPARRAAATSGPASSLWGHGWFLLSNPSYGPALAGTLDEVYGAPAWAPADHVPAFESGSIDGVMAALYGSISGPPGPRDWNRLRALFAPNGTMGAVGPKGVRTRDVEGYIAVNGPYLKDHGFFEREAWRQTRQFGDLAQIWSAYEGRETPDGPIIDSGINAIQLGRHGDKWVILSLLWQEAGPTLPLPAK